MMQAIYGGKYMQRFDPVNKSIPVHCRSVLELCFGDLIIADYCKEKNISWTGYDINQSFVDNAVKKGYNAMVNDIIEMGDYPAVDLVVMTGSLYHFHDRLDELFLKITRSTNHIIISEPIKNLSSMAGPIGYLSRKLANAGKGSESFRFTKNTLLAGINSIEVIKANYGIKIVHQNRDLILELCKK